MLQAGGSRALGVRFCLSGVTPGDREDLTFRRVSERCALRRTPHARLDSLEHSVVSVLARTFLAGDATVDGIVARASIALGTTGRWLPPLAARYIRTYANQTRPRHRDVVQFLLRDRGFARAWSKYRDELTVERWLNEPQQMQPVAAAGTWPIPAIESIGALAEWLRADTRRPGLVRGPEGSRKPGEEPSTATALSLPHSHEVIRQRSID